MNIRAVAMRAVLAVLFFAALSTAAASAMELVGPQELKAAWLDGRTIATVGPRGGKSTFAFAPDGTLTRSGGRTGSAAAGAWRLDDEGFCMTLGNAKRESCYVAIRGEGGAIRVMRRSAAFTWTR